MTDQPTIRPRRFLVKARHAVATLCFMGLFCMWFASAQDLILRPSAPTRLKLVVTGNGTTKKDGRTAFRVYEAPDGTKGNVVYSEFDSLQAAQKHIEEAIKVTSSVTSREQNQTNEKGQLVDDRILAIGDLPGSHKKEFVIIGRDGLYCYVIESVSLQVVIQIEGLIQHR